MVLLLERLKAMAEGHGVSLLYEFIGFGHHAFPSLDEVHALAAVAGRPLVLDTFHLAVSGTSQSVIEGLQASETGLVHLSDAIVDTGDVTTIADADRVLSGEGQLALSEILGAILTTGYDGPVSMEVFHPMHGDRAPEDVAREAYDRAMSLLSQVPGGPTATGD